MEIMKRFWEATIGHTRVVISGSYPLYRLFCMLGIISSILTFSYWKFPVSFSEVTDNNNLAGAIFNSMQLVGCCAVVGSLYLHRDKDPSHAKVQLSLTIERIGCILLVPVIAAYTYGVIHQNSGPPTTWATCGLVAFGLYLIIRFFEIGNALKELQRPIEKCDGYECDTEELRGE